MDFAAARQKICQHQYYPTECPTCSRQQMTPSEILMTELKMIRPPVRHEYRTVSGGLVDQMVRATAAAKRNRARPGYKGRVW